MVVTPPGKAFLILQSAFCILHCYSALTVRDQALKIVEKAPILEVTLANPPDNRLTPEMVAGLNGVMERIESDDFDVLLITGSQKVFCKGFDLDAVTSRRDPAQLRRDLVSWNAVFSRIAKSPKPTVAAVHGACLGAGLELALACHFRLCAEKTRLGLPEVWNNLLPGLGGFFRLARLVGRAKALELVALGDLITAEEALRLNVVSRVFPRKGFADRVASFVRALLVADRQVVREAIHLAACSAAQGEEDDIRQGIESCVKLAQWLPKT
jgi:enoyl-CoA hydratase